MDIKLTTFVMNEELVTFETAKLAKECGFNWKTHMIWNFDIPPWRDDDDGKPKQWFHHEREYLDDIPGNEPWYYSPTQGHLAKWLRDMHRIQVYAISRTRNGLGIYRDYVVYINNIEQNDARDEEFQSYEDAMEFGLKLALKLVIK